MERFWKHREIDLQHEGKQFCEENDLAEGAACLLLR